MDINKYGNRIKFLILIFVMVLFWYLGRYFHLDTQSIQNSLGRFPKFYSGFAYVALYVVVTFFVWFSKDAFWLIGAVLFGAASSALLIWTSETINACVLFYISRRLGRGYVEHSLGGKYSRIDERLGNLNFFWLFLFRLAPLIPYRFLDLGAGLTRITFKKYMAAVILGSPLKIFWIQCILAAVGKSIFDNPYAVAEYLRNNKTLFLSSLIYLILVALVAIKIKRKD
jgi:uncharacterized membrane protein YdjX (TVP38/TMEM64 family)